MNDSNKSPEQVNSSSAKLLKLIERICGPTPPKDPDHFYVPIPIMRKLILKMGVRGRMLSMLIGEWSQGERIMEGLCRDERATKDRKIYTKLSEKGLIEYNSLLDLITLNEEQVLSLLNRLFPEQNKRKS